MDESEGKLKYLVSRLIAYEASELMHGRRKRTRFNINPGNFSSTDEAKKEIYSWFIAKNMPYDPKKVRAYAMEFLEERLRIPGVARTNPSFAALKDRITRGEYDFDFSRRQK